MKKKLLSLYVLSSTLSLLNGTVLTFDFIPGLNNANLISQDYGDNVNAATEGSFSYGTAGGFTPNVSVDYFGNSAGLEALSFWTTGYDDLTNVAYYEPEVDSVFGLTFTADAGYQVTLESFQLGYYLGTGNLAEIAVLIGDRNGSPSSFGLTNESIGGGTATTYIPNITANQITLRFTTTGAGGANDNFGIDNVQFSQIAVPEPSVYSALLGATAMLFVLSRRKLG